jgi:hypothetical protein
MIEISICACRDFDLRVIEILMRPGEPRFPGQSEDRSRARAVGRSSARPWASRLRPVKGRRALIILVARHARQRPAYKRQRLERPMPALDRRGAPPTTPQTLHTPGKGRAPKPINSPAMAAERSSA